MQGHALVIVTGSGDGHVSMSAWLWVVPKGAEAGAWPREKHGRLAAVEGLAVNARFVVRSSGRWLFCLCACMQGQALGFVTAPGDRQGSEAA